MMATSSPLLNFPEIPFRRVLYPAESTSHSFPAIAGSVGSTPTQEGQTRKYTNDTTKAKSKIFHALRKMPSSG